MFTEESRSKMFDQIPVQQFAGACIRTVNAIQSFLISLAVAFGITSLGTPAATQNTPFPTVIAQCKAHFQLDQRNLMYRGEGSMPYPLGRQLFHACVQKKSGNYSPAERKSSVTISGTAYFGVVFSD